jgi:choline dehydrogenase-like flavoprotein
MGGDPLEGEGIRFTCIVELAVGAGELKLASTDPHVQPDLNYGYLEDAWNRERLREGVRLCLKLLESESYQSFVEECISPTAEDLVSDGTLDQWLLRNVTTTQHICGTCKMGPDSDPTAVVDQYCRVHGLEALRVVDVSVLPDCIRANTNATTIMIAERVADWMT